MADQDHEKMILVGRAGNAIFFPKTGTRKSPKNFSGLASFLHTQASARSPARNDFPADNSMTHSHYAHTMRTRTSHAYDLWSQSA